MGTADLLPLALAPGLRSAATADPADYLHRAVLAAGRGTEWPAQAFAVAIQRVGIVGAGAMGTGIAISFLNAGVPVVLLDCTAPALEQGRARVREAFCREAGVRGLPQSAG